MSTNNSCLSAAVIASRSTRAQRLLQIGRADDNRHWPYQRHLSSYLTISDVSELGASSFLAYSLFIIFVGRKNILARWPTHSQKSFNLQHAASQFDSYSIKTNFCSVLKAQCPMLWLLHSRYPAIYFILNKKILNRFDSRKTWILRESCLIPIYFPEATATIPLHSLN